MFNRILRGNDLSLNIGLEKIEYSPGQRMRGLITIKTKKGCRVRQLKLLVEGRETTEISEYSNKIKNNQIYKEANIFFSEDISYLLRKPVDNSILQDGIYILPQNREVEFDYILPIDDSLFFSYNGKHASIIYAIKLIADTAKRLDVTTQTIFLW
jgi:Arrestin (or S-antigen), N-terminal domain